MEFDPVDACLPGAPGGLGKQAGHCLRQVSYMGEVQVGDPFPVSHSQRLQLSFRQDRIQFFIRETRQVCPDLFFRPVKGAQLFPVMVGDNQETGKISGRVRTAANSEKVDHLDQQAGFPVACSSHRISEFPQTRYEPVVADTQQRPAGYVPNACGLDDDGSRLPFRKTFIPVQHVIGDKPVLVGTPWDHCRHPGALFQGDWAEPDR